MIDSIITKVLYILGTSIFAFLLFKDATITHLPPIWSPIIWVIFIAVFIRELGLEGRPYKIIDGEKDYDISWDIGERR